MEATCRASGARFEISAEDEDYYRRMDVPLPTISPLERMRRRMAWRRTAVMTVLIVSKFTTAKVVMNALTAISAKSHIIFLIALTARNVGVRQI